MLDLSEFSPGLLFCELETENKKSQELPGGQPLPGDKFKEANLQGSKNNRHEERSKNKKGRGHNI